MSVTFFGGALAFFKIGIILPNMQETVIQALSKAFLKLFRPLARILIRNGVSFSAMSEWAKKVYVDVAFDEFKEPGKKQTISRVSALTGLFRREVKRLHDLDADTELDSADRYNRAVRVISGWLNDADYRGASNRPLTLPFEGPGASFSSLVRAYSGDIPARAMLTVLESANCVEETSSGKLRLVQHAFIPGNDATDKLQILGSDVAELIATIDHNLSSPPDDLYFQRKVSNTRIHPDAVVHFRRLASERAQALLEELDAWLSDHELSEEDTEHEAQHVSLGIFYAQDHSTSPVTRKESP